MPYALLTVENGMHEEDTLSLYLDVQPKPEWFGELSKVPKIDGGVSKVLDAMEADGWSLHTMTSAGNSKSTREVYVFKK